MIHESLYWKAPLLRSANWLEHLRFDEKTEERALVRVERELFIGFYSIRKLLETFKLSVSTKSLVFHLQWSPCIKMVDYFNAHRIDELFDLLAIKSEDRDLAFLCNQFIHSYVFVPVHHKACTLAGVYVSSDRTRHAKLYFVELNQVIHAFRTVGRDYKRELHLRRNAKTNQWEEI